MLRYTLAVVTSFFWASTLHAEQSAFSEFADIYVAAFERVIADHTNTDRIFAVSMTIQDDERLVPLPDGLWKRVVKRLEARSIDLSHNVPVEDVLWVKDDMKFIHKTSHEDVWVATIGGIQWRGSNRLYVPVSVVHHVLSSAGSTLVMQQRSGEWTVAFEENEWISAADQDGSIRPGATVDYVTDTELHPRKSGIRDAVLTARMDAETMAAGVASMPNRQYVCSKCGSMHRAAKVYSREQHDHESWPRCCLHSMTLLTLVQAEAATQLTEAQRKEWLAAGGHVVRRGGKHRWKPVTADWQIEEAQRQVAAHDPKVKKKYVPPE